MVRSATLSHIRVAPWSVIVSFVSAVLEILSLSGAPNAPGLGSLLVGSGGLPLAGGGPGGPSGPEEEDRGSDEPSPTRFPRDGSPNPPDDTPEPEEEDECP